MSCDIHVDYAGMRAGWAVVNEAIAGDGEPGAELDCGKRGDQVDVGFLGFVGWGLGEGVEMERHLLCLF